MEKLTYHEVNHDKAESGLAQVSPVLKPTKNSHPKENAPAKEREK